MIKAICLLSSDRSFSYSPHISNRISDAQFCITLCLEYLLHKRFEKTKVPIIMAKLIHLLTRMRSIGNMFKSEEKQMIADWPDIEFPAIFREMWMS